MKKIISLLLSLSLLSACQSQENSEKPQVLVSFYVLEELTSMIAGDSVTVINLLPVNAEPHEYELTSTDMVTLGSSPYLIIIGNGFESWYEEAYPQVRPSDADVLDVSTSINPLHFENGSVDPHIWSSITNLRIISAEIEAYLSKHFPENESLYQANLGLINDRLDAIQKNTSDLFESRQRSVFVTQHPAFNYLAHELNLINESVTLPGHLAEVDAKRLQDVIHLIQDQSISIVFYENPLEKDIADTLALETGVQTEYLSALESIDPKQGLDLIDLVEHNYQVLAESLQ